MTQTLTTERLKQITDAISAEPHDYESIYDSIKHGEIAAMARELLANREAQPVGLKKVDSSNVSFAGDGFNAAVDYCADAVRAAGFKVEGDK